MITIDLNLELLLILRSKSEWVNKIPKLLPNKIYSKEDFLWIDSLGNKMVIGSDFSAAEVLHSYPVIYL